MKTITIPTNHNPYTVVINNKEYTYKGGDTIEVPDEVAEAIQDALELEPKPKRYLSGLAQIANGTITEITLSDLDGIETIVAYAFSYCTQLKSVTIPHSVASIGSGAFYGCSRLKSVVFEDKGMLGSIDAGAFGRCGQLTRVFLPETPPTLTNIDAFDRVDANCTFSCPSQASLDAYKAAPIWGTLAGTYAFVVGE